MIEWTICKNCSKLLDNSNDKCPFCGSDVKKIGIDFLKDYLFKLSFTVKTVDNVSLIPELSQKNITLNSVVINDLVNWFSYLSGDKLTDNELDFINDFLDVSYTKEEISQISSKLESRPMSFRYMKEIDDSGWMNNNSKMLYDLFSLSGKLFITVDGELDDDALKRYENFMNRIEEYNYQTADFTPNPIPESKPAEKADEKTLDEYLEELNTLIGLENVKKDVNSLINLVQIRKLRDERGIKQPSFSLHLVFSGNPGTGKTTVARLLSKIYNKIGVLSKGHLIETDRSGLVGGYVGQTAIKTQEVISSAMGGILFIDEAYSLAKDSQNDYGQEAIDTILKAMEDNREDLIVIVAGYPELMDNFLHSNPGLESRFNKFIYFEDYTSEELCEIFHLMCSQSDLVLDKPAEEYLKQYYDKICENRPQNFANGRAVRNFFEDVLTAQANRLAPKKDITDEELNTLTYEDFLID